MTERDPNKDDVDRFLNDNIDTVPHLEALLLLWNSRPRDWPVGEMAERLFLSADSTTEILSDLVRLGLVGCSPDSPNNYFCPKDSRQEQILADVDATYRHELIRVSRLIHSKPSAAVRAFARAFRFKKGD
ncbi:MAG TPA: hypothetical protein VG273_18550 [Bryobacteraceae bacterium]|jgi:hypothetical protein|nr:hypothetical protein [Bryobacteraceae bacterium]